MKLYPHQDKFLSANPDKALLCFGAGTGKTLTAIEWIKKRQDRSTIVICPKSLKQRWIDDTMSVSNVVVHTKEEFKKLDLSVFDNMVFDEVHNANSPLFTKQRSQVSTSVYNWIRQSPDKCFLGLTATPISSQPWNIHTLLTFSGRYIPHDKKASKLHGTMNNFQDRFYRLEKRGFMKGRYAYFPIPEWRSLAKELVLKYCYTATMSDIIGHIPEQHKNVVKIPLSKIEKELIDWQKDNPDHDSDVAIWYAQHRLEQGKAKIEKIKEISSRHSKVVIFAKYREQIEALEKALKNERQVYVMTGSTKDQGAVIKQAQNDSECFFIIQADISEGYELPDFGCVIYASQSWRKISDVQSQARVQRINNLKTNWYYWLIAGDKDRVVFNAIEKGEDFIIQ